ncbi:hypothetical protein AtDm6_0580 [Acetobacter tropicalis]|uniref:Uncharacterized protein n=1 Tax=Acetobacter tropicalis TaxID=104102 RepID=A0A094YTP6_9PROT|nr:hypothetical protein AtDm6_0580 [Acetobacter tropicalis]
MAKGFVRLFRACNPAPQDAMPGLLSPLTSHGPINSQPG